MSSFFIVIFTLVALVIAFSITGINESLTKMIDDVFSDNHGGLR